MLHWAKFGGTIGIVGAVMCGIIPIGTTGEKEKVVGVMLAVYGMLMMIYGQAMFYLRAGKIRMRVRGRFDDPIGPVFIVIGFVFMLTVRLIMDALDGQDSPIPINNQGCI